MMTKALLEIMQRVQSWPEAAQHELAAIVEQMHAELQHGTYEPTPEELTGIDRGLKDAAEGRFASDEQVEAVLTKFRQH
jgi:predicted transcriptional regulator